MVALEGATAEQVPAPEHSYPELHSNTLLHRVQAAGFARVVAEQVLPVPAALHTYVPEFVEPHALALEVQAPPSPVTSSGLDAEHTPVH